LHGKRKIENLYNYKLQIIAKRRRITGYTLYPASNFNDSLSVFSVSKNYLLLLAVKRLAGQRV